MIPKMQCIDMLMEQSVILTKLYHILENCSITTLVLISLVITYIILYKLKRERLVRLIDKLPGPPGLPLIGNAIEINVEHDGELSLKFLSFNVYFKFFVTRYFI